MHAERKIIITIVINYETKHHNNIKKLRKKLQTHTHTHTHCIMILEMGFTVLNLRTV